METAQALRDAERNFSKSWLSRAEREARRGRETVLHQERHRGAHQRPGCGPAGLQEQGQVVGGGLQKVLV